MDNEAIQSDMLAYLVFILNGACMKIVEAPPINTRHVVERLQQGITHEELAQLLGRRRGRAMPPVVVDILKRLRTFFYMWQFVTVFERLPPEWQSTHEDLQAQIEDIRASTEDMRSGYTPNQQRWYAQLLKLFSTKYVTPAHPLFNLDINAHPRLRWAQVVGDREGMRHFVDTELRHFRQTGELTIEAKLQRWIEGEFDKLSSLEQRIIQGNKRAYQGTDAEWFLVMAYMYQTSFTDKEKMGVLASLSLRLWEFSMAVIEGEKA